jgi:hypothetical protein
MDCLVSGQPLRRRRHRPDAGRAPRNWGVEVDLEPEADLAMSMCRRSRLAGFRETRRHSAQSAIAKNEVMDQCRAGMDCGEDDKSIR